VSRRTGRLLGILLVVLAAVGAVGLVLTQGRDDGDAAAPDPALTTTTTAPPPPVEEAIELGDGLVLAPVGEVPGATALSIVDGRVRATDATTGSRYSVAVAGGSVEGPVAFGAQSRLDRSVADPRGAGRWVAEATALHRIDDEGEILETVTLDVPGAITEVTEEALWLTVSGVAGSHGGGGAASQSVVQRVDLDTLEVVARPLDDPATFRFALTGDAAWVTVGRTLYRLDPSTLEPSGEVELSEPASALVATDSGVAAVVGGTEPTAVVVSAADLRQAGIPLGPGSVGDAVHAGDAFGANDEIWVLRPDEGLVTRIDLADGASPRSFEVPAPRRIELADGAAWILSDAGGGTLLRVGGPAGEE
jgi:hypothetical protein